jgi:hypothetical protein
VLLVFCLIVLILPPGKNTFAVKINNKNKSLGDEVLSGKSIYNSDIKEFGFYSKRIEVTFFHKGK